MGNSGTKRTSKVHVLEPEKASATSANDMHQQDSSQASSYVVVPAIATSSSPGKEESSTRMSKHLLTRTPSPAGSCSPTKPPEGFFRSRSRSGSSPGFKYTPEFRFDSSLSVDKATSHCKVLLMQLSNGTIPDSDQLEQSISYVMDVLQCMPPAQRGSISSLGCGRLETLDDEDVRAWLTSTFTHSESKQSTTDSPKPRFKAVVDTIMVGQYFQKKIQDTTVTYPDGVEKFFKENRDQWNCDVFYLNSLTSGQPLKYFGHEIFKFYGFTDQFKISTATLNSFLETVEKGYNKHNNPYHNSIHGTDVTQTVHYFIQSANLQLWLSDIEILSMIFAALVHDIEHTGTSNAFHVQTKSELALCYNDISVLENFHLFRAFSILTEDSTNILKGVSNEDFAIFRSLVIEMVLGTDMSKHFDHLKYMKKLIQSPEDVCWTKLKAAEKPKVLSLFLHMADISHPGKRLDLHQQWTDRLVEEFFRQGDREKELKLDCSPLCDRNATKVPESQTGFIRVIVSPVYDVCGNYLELISKKLSQEYQKPSKPEKERSKKEKESIQEEEKVTKQEERTREEQKVAQQKESVPEEQKVSEESNQEAQIIPKSAASTDVRVIAPNTEKLRVWNIHLEENMKYWSDKCNPPPQQQKKSTIQKSEEPVPTEEKLTEQKPMEQKST